MISMVRAVLAPSSVAIARSRRFPSAFSSDTILCVSKIAPLFLFTVAARNGIGLVLESKEKQ